MEHIVGRWRNLWLVETKNTKNTIKGANNGNNKIKFRLW